MFVDFLIFALSLAALVFGADWCLAGAERIGERLKLSPLMIGALLIGIGTSLPELFVTQFAAFRGEPDVGAGNIIGSNIANLLLILGVSATLIPLRFSSPSQKKQVTLHFFLTITFLTLLSIGKEIGPLKGFVLFGFFFVYLKMSLNQMVEGSGDDDDHTEEKLPIKRAIFSLVGGLGLLFVGGDFLVKSVVDIGNHLGVAPYIVSAIVLALGTSLPELITAIMVCRKNGDGDLIIGNIIGSNVFNVALIFASTTFYRYELAVNVKTELATLLLVSVTLLVLSRSQYAMRKTLGFVFLAGYAGICYYWAFLSQA